MSELQKLRKKIVGACTYLQDHFDDSLSPDQRARFCLTFPDIDRACILWRAGPAVIHYRLAFLPDGEMEWRGWRHRSQEKVATVPVNKKGASD